MAMLAAFNIDDFCKIAELTTELMPAGADLTDQDPVISVFQFFDGGGGGGGGPVGYPIG
jgi:hypothetical protein